MEEREASDWERAESAASITIDSAFAVHSYAGPGLLEKAYVVFLAQELRARGIPVRVQVELPVSYRGANVDLGFRVDLLVDEALIVEVKACAHLLPVHSAQLLSYLRLADRRIGILINFHELRLKHGIRRVVNSKRWPGAS
jgi:GxxExxY protein